MSEYNLIDFVKIPGYKNLLSEYEFSKSQALISLPRSVRLPFIAAIHHDLNRTIQDLVSGLQGIGFKDRNFRESKLIRLVVVNELLSTGILDESLHVVR